MSARVQRGPSFGLVGASDVRRGAEADEDCEDDEADPKAGSISFVSPVARLLMGKAVGDEVGASGQNLEIISIS